MSIAESFADIYIEYIKTESDRFTDQLFKLYPTSTIRDMIVNLYWRISNEYDITNHAPVPDDLWLSLMNFNIRLLFYNILSSDTYDVYDDINELIRLSYQNDISIVIDRDRVLSY